MPGTVVAITLSTRRVFAEAETERAVRSPTRAQGDAR